MAVSLWAQAATNPFESKNNESGRERGWQANWTGDLGTLQVGMMTISLTPFQIPQMVRVTGVSGLSAASPVETATRNGPVLVVMHALQQSQGPVTVQTAQVIVGLWLQVQGEGFFHL